MKTLRTTLSVLLGVAAVIGVHAADKSDPSRVEVTFSDPDKFTDAADGPRGTDIGRDGNLDDLKEFIVRRANSVLPADQKLSVTITDVDLAGEIEPWRSANARDVRIIKDIYIPRIELSFKLTDASGVVIKEGTRRLSDMSFNMKLHASRNDPRVHDKGLLDDWIRSEFRTKK